jgi:hypothetical protein
MDWITGLLLNLNHITTGKNTASWTGWWLYVIWMTIVVAVWWAASPLTLRYPRVVQKTGMALIGWAKALLENTDPRATYPEKAISLFFWPNGTLPTSQEYASLRDHEFRDYTLRVDGLVDKPVTLSYDQLKAMPKQEQITSTTASRAGQASPSGAASRCETSSTWCSQRRRRASPCSTPSAPAPTEDCTTTLTRSSTCATT